ncbi:MAG: prepilin-type N-terminal cleavage/methylation domain-containing protein, partial [Tepidisphaeraceae bacterium]
MNIAAGGQHGHRAGFSFIELMFAVAVLGLGLIMVSAIFPAAIAQTQAAIDETTAAAVVRNGAHYMAASMTAANTRATEGFIRLSSGTPELWAALRSSQISQADQRYAWVGFYDRDEEAPFARVVVVAVRQRTREGYDPRVDLSLANGGLTEPATLEAHGAKVALVAGENGGEDMVQFAQEQNGAVKAVAEGM